MASTQAPIISSSPRQAAAAEAAVRHTCHLQHSAPAFGRGAVLIRSAPGVTRMPTLCHPGAAYGMTMHCPCGSGERYAACCEPLHAGATAVTAEALMRSRYSAYVLGLISYLVSSTHASTRAHHDPISMARWSSQAEWQGLEIHRTIAGGPEAALGTVDFTAHWLEAGTPRTLREHSVFVRENGRWYYRDGEAASVLPGRKDPCLCGSGKAFKRCCG